MSTSAFKRKEYVFKPRIDFFFLYYEESVQKNVVPFFPDIISGMSDDVQK